MYKEKYKEIKAIEEFHQGLIMAYLDKVFLFSCSLACHRGR